MEISITTNNDLKKNLFTKKNSNKTLIRITVISHFNNKQKPKYFEYNLEEIALDP